MSEKSFAKRAFGLQHLADTGPGSTLRLPRREGGLTLYFLGALLGCGASGFSYSFFPRTGIG